MSEIKICDYSTEAIIHRVNVLLSMGKVNSDVLKEERVLERELMSRGCRLTAKVRGDNNDRN